jgi:hypothetical protein
MLCENAPSPARAFDFMAIDREKPMPYEQAFLFRGLKIRQAHFGTTA